MEKETPTLHYQLKAGERKEWDKEVRTVLNGSRVSTETLVAKGGDTLKRSLQLIMLVKESISNP